jgi:hypothetical protein
LKGALKMISTKAIQINNLREQLLKQAAEMAKLEKAVKEVQLRMNVINFGEMFRRDLLIHVPADFPAFLGIDPGVANESRTTVFVPPAEETSLQPKQSS